jgi:hypothetical protein
VVIYFKGENKFDYLISQELGKHLESGLHLHIGLGIPSQAEQKPAKGKLSQSTLES